MIVDFMQDPNAPFGSGNFRDDSGRITYLHDPDTAGEFVKTLPGSGTKGGGGPLPADTQPGVAAQQGINDTNAAIGGLEQKLASNDTGQPVPVGAPPPMPNTSAPTAGENMSISATPAEVQSLSRPQQLVSALNKATGSPGPSPSASRPQQLVSAVSKATSQPAPTGPLPPISGVSTTNNTSVTYGRDGKAVDADIAAREHAGQTVDTSLLDAGKQKDATNIAGLDAQGRAADLRRQREDQRITEAKAERQKAIDDKTKVEAALKQNDNSLDPDHYMKTMSTGSQVGMTILAVLNGAFGSLNGQKGNGVIDVLNKNIDTDLDRQKQEIASGRIRMGNQIQEFINQGHDAKTAEALARDRLDAAVDQKLEIDAKKLAVTGENAEQAKLLIAQRQEARAAQRGDLLAQKESRVQETTSRVVERAIPKPVNSVEQMLQLAQLESAQLKLGNERVAQADAVELSGDIYGRNEKGQPLKMLNPDQVKDVKDKAATVGPALAETSGAVNMTKVLVDSLGGKLDETTGQITWPEDGEVKGAGPVDKRGGYLGANPVGYGLRQAGLWRADVDKVHDAQAALKEFVTSQLTGANSNLRQDATFGSMVGGDLSNESQTKENLQNWSNTLFAARQQHMARLGDAGMRYQRQLEQKAKAGADAPPLVRRQTTGAVGSTVVPEEPRMSVNP